MSLTNSGLPNGGTTTHYSIQYDKTLSSSDGLEVAKGLVQHCEADFELLKSWFGGIDPQFGYPLPVNIVNGSGGAGWNCPPEEDLDFGTVSPPVTIAAGSPSSVILVRSLLVAEVSEMFMFSQNGGWFEPDGFFQGSNEGSKGEGLSRFLTVQLKVANGLGDVPEPGYAVSSKWLNSPRQDFVDSNPDDNGSDPTTGCTTLFIYYLNSQLGYSINQIVANSASNLSGVYKNLTGFPDGWTPFINLVNLHYPPGTNYNMATDNLFPVPNLSQFQAPDPITFGYEDNSAQLILDTDAPADVVIQLKSHDTNIATVPAKVTIPAGNVSVSVPIKAKLASSSSPGRSVVVEATYAGQTLDIEVYVGPPALAGFTISPSSINYGETATATLTLNNASLDGVVSVSVAGDPGFDGIQKPILIPKGLSTWQFTITPAIDDPYLLIQDEIYATLGSQSLSASLTIGSSTEVGILYGVTAPGTVLGGTSFIGSVYIQNAVSTDTPVGLFARGAHIAGQPGLIFPKSNVVTLPTSVTIPAGQIRATFQGKTFMPPDPSLSVGTQIAANTGPIRKYTSVTVVGSLPTTTPPGHTTTTGVTTPGGKLTGNKAP